MVNEVGSTDAVQEGSMSTVRKSSPWRRLASQGTPTSDRDRLLRRNL